MSKTCESCGGTGTANHERKGREERSREILDAAVEIARELGYRDLTHSRIATEVCVSPSLVRKYYDSKSKIRDAVMSEAVRLKIPEIILQGLAAKDPIAHSAPAELRQAALAGCA